MIRETGLYMAGPKFSLGRVVATDGAVEMVAIKEIIVALIRHSVGDWGELEAEDKAQNDSAVQTGERLLSAYESTMKVRFWIITEADRVVTTILLPREY